MLSANESLVATASLGVNATNMNTRTMIISGVAWLLVGACIRVISELVSVYSQYDIEMTQIEREDRSRVEGTQERDVWEKLPSPWQAVRAFALASAVGSLVPLLAVTFIEDYKLRLLVVMTMASIALVSFGALNGKLGNVPMVKSAIRAL
ncbi:hypothetical protein ACJRO7_015302 [Eucalyptus globulus]|uniref:Vacuolar iron transporter n=1 Tax=Eucalyptus globulus TaxID=34317 RepID=A0ABD3L491_EUCGL